MKYYGESERAYHRSMRRERWVKGLEIAAQILAAGIVIYLFCTL